MYGEKVEETEELRLDLQDVKDMYKMQIEDLLRKQNASWFDQPLETMIRNLENDYCDIIII